MNKMKAVVCTKYGPPEVLQLKEVTKPQPRENEVLIKVYAATAHVGDTRIRKADPFLVRIVFGLFSPNKNLIPGMELSGVIESIGQQVTKFKVGDQVMAFTGFGLGGNAEYRCLAADVKAGKHLSKGLIALKPANLTYAEAAAIPAGGTTALKNLQKANIRKGHSILINGASGSLGTYAIQLAKYYGAEVTAVCSGSNFDLVKSLGADHVIDYTKEDFTERQDRYDIVYDAVVKVNPAKCRKLLKPGGVFVNNSRLPKMKEEDLLLLKDLVESDRLKPVIDRTYSLDQIVEAHRYVDTGRKKGNVVIVVNKD